MCYRSILHMALIILTLSLTAARSSMPGTGLFLLVPATGLAMAAVGTAVVGKHR